MIFKVYQPLTGKWFLYDNIKLVKTHYIEKLPEGPMDGEEFVNLLQQDVEYKPFGIAEVDLIFRDSVRTVVFGSGEGFLMNDEGKTIERL